MQANNIAILSVASAFHTVTGVERTALDVVIAKHLDRISAAVANNESLPDTLNDILTIESTDGLKMGPEEYVGLITTLFTAVETQKKLGDLTNTKDPALSVVTPINANPGMSTLSKILIGAAVVGVVGAAAYYVFGNNDDSAEAASGMLIDGTAELLPA